MCVCARVSTKYYTYVYRTALNFDRENIDEFDEFPAIRQNFPYQNFLFS